MNKCDALYYCDYLITQNSSRKVWEKAALATTGNRIAAIGGRSDISRNWAAGRIIDLGAAVILPGLVNGHTHIAMSFLRGRADDKPLMDWLTQDIFPIEAKLTPDIIRMACEFSCAEMIRTGTTALFDMYPLENAVFKAVDRMGMRAVMGESVSMYPTASYKTAEEALEIVREQGAAWGGHQRIKGAVVPHSIYTTTPEILVECRDIAHELGWSLGMHLSETSFETNECIDLRGKRPVEYCAELGLLGRKSTFFHMVDVNGSDLDLIAESGSAVVHNPVSNMKLASGFAPLGEMLARGIPLGLGTDGPASNNAQNMVREMHLCALLQKGINLDATAMPAQTVLDMATTGGAKALHWEGLGSLEPGNLADFIALDLSQPNMQPVYNIVSNVVYAATGMETCLNVVDGEILYHNGKYTRCDYEALRREINDIRDWVWNQG